MNEIVNKFLLAGENFMLEMHLKQPGFNCSTCGPFTKNKERIQKIKGTGDTTYIYRNELDKACFQHDMAYGGFKDLAKITASDKVLREKAFNIAKNLRYEGYQRGLASMVYKFFYSSGVTLANKSSFKNETLAKELRKPIIRNFKKGSVFRIQRQCLGY